MEKWILAAMLARLFYLRGAQDITISSKHVCLNISLFIICLVCMHEPDFISVSFEQQLGYLGLIGLLISASISDYYTYTLYFFDECLVSGYWTLLCLWSRPYNLIGSILICSVIGLIAKILTYWKKQTVFGEGDYLIIFCIFLALGWTSGLLILWFASSFGVLYLLFKKTERLPFVPFLGIASLLVFLFS